MDKIKPIEVAKWFIKSDLDVPKNSFNGNMKLQKLIFFAQLIYMYKNNKERMFDEQFNAFENGMVLEVVRKEYHDNYNQLNMDSKDELDINPNIEESLILTKEIFGKYDSDELSKMSHQFEAWNKYFKKSIKPNYINFKYDKDKSKVPYSELIKELFKIEKVVKAYENTQNLDFDDEDY